MQHAIGDRALVLNLSASRNLTLALPRTFRGNLRVMHPASDNIKLSPSLRGAVAYIHDTGGTCNYFIDEYGALLRPSHSLLPGKVVYL